MAGFIKGEVVVIPFPFSDLSDSKRRPALVLADLPDNDILLCQITSRSAHDDLTVQLRVMDFSIGSLPIDSFIRPTRIFTADKKHNYSQGRENARVCCQRGDRHYY